MEGRKPELPSSGAEPSLKVRLGSPPLSVPASNGTPGKFSWELTSVSKLFWKRWALMRLYPNLNSLTWFELKICVSLMAALRYEKSSWPSKNPPPSSTLLNGEGTKLG